MEEFVASNQLDIINESTRTTFLSSRGKSNIDLNITNNQMLAHIQNWDISEEESASDHNIIKFNINLGRVEGNAPDFPERRFIIKEHRQTEFYEKFHHIASTAFRIVDRGRENEDLDAELDKMFNEKLNIREFTMKLEEAIQTACRETTRNRNTPNPQAKGKTVPWWTTKLKIM